MTRLWAGLVQSTGQKCPTDPYLAMHWLYEGSIVQSPWLDRAKLILIKSGLCVWVKQSFSGVNSLCKHNY